MEKPLIDILWVLICAMLVFVMQAGFLCLESGLTRAKNNINVAVKNLADLGVSVLLFWAVGYALMFGVSESGWFGKEGYFPNMADSGMWPTTFFFYQVMFCGTAVTIVAGAVAERLRFVSYLLIALVVSGLIYPVFGHWAWNGAIDGGLTGWLGQQGFVDFAGSTVVHSVGGWVSLAVLLVVGARDGRFSQEGTNRRFPGSNLPIAVLGVLLLWFGWFGFNGGSTSAFNHQVPLILMNTLVAGAAGLLTGMITNWTLCKRADVCVVKNGALAGLVAITANCHAVTTLEAFVIGGIGGLVMLGVDRLLNRWHVDDAVSAIPAHLGAGIWGTLAVAIFGDLDVLATGLSRWAQFQAQVMGVVTCFLWTFGVSYGLFKVLNHLMPLRITPEAEAVGLNVSEHGASTDLVDLFSTMDQQAKTGDLSLRVPVESFTEVGQIANQYNRVMDALEGMTAELEQKKTNLEQEILQRKVAETERERLHHQLVDASRHAGMAEVATSILHNFGNVLNSVNVSVGLIKKFVRQTPADKISRTASMIQQHAQDLGAYLTQDPKGKKIPDYLTELGKHLAQEQTGTLKEVEELTNHIEHIMEIVNVQQTLTKTESQLLEPLSPRELIEEAYAVYATSIEDRGIEVIREFEDVPPVVADRHKAHEILAALISNAQRAVFEGPDPSRRLVLRVGLASKNDDRVSILVSDNGVGIQREQLTRIFAQDFSLRKAGHDFGLHHSALSAKLMGGSLTAYSDGEGQGATFTLELPAESWKVKREMLLVAREE